MEVRGEMRRRLAGQKLPKPLQCPPMSPLCLHGAGMAGRRWQMLDQTGKCCVKCVGNNIVGLGIKWAISQALLLLWGVGSQEATTNHPTAHETPSYDICVCVEREGEGRVHSVQCVRCGRVVVPAAAAMPGWARPGLHSSLETYPSCPPPAVKRWKVGEVTWFVTVTYMGVCEV